ncbi:MAG: uroporphyrinogen-III C-methyltransferase [Oceanospirillaceae bacterium]|jgi:uroporphyrin-III C-methyltransferase/precorrin-2 dehydrogenase/sirohydrochlorin ferrochelatase|nr:uroporphyrinogen-III C-methyltransferase [Oceanospirillaceae bacterium]MBT4441893.1 uroporphyrinogen-III C-methyltransferase [Oceanospirillaceae bacterium]MBT6076429.1 uroporphyrinogen-III C-methyltransferase [Oceanospirillaceae bacterium]
MSYFPLFHNTQNLKALIVGGGKIAQRRTNSLLDAGVACDILATAVVEPLRTLVESAGGTVTIDAYTNDEVMLGYGLILAVTDDRAVNQTIAQHAKAMGLLINVADAPDDGNVIFGATIDRAPLTIAINNGGASPVLSSILRQQLEQFVPKAYGQLAALVGRYREQVKQSLPSTTDRSSFWHQVLQGAVAEAVFSGKQDEAEALLKKALASADKLGEQGEVYLIGAGPGDPDLLTLRAFRLLQKADVVLYDALVSDGVMALVPPLVERVYVGKRRANHSVPQTGINQLLVDYAQQGKRVARLKGGDPFIFGRGGEEIETLAEQQVPFQVVPGITAASGCSAYSGIPLTHRDYAQSVRFVTGQLRDGSVNLAWPELIVKGQTLVFYMGLKGLPYICQQLIAHGMDATMPVALIEKGTTQDQRVLVSDLTGLPHMIEAEKVMSPSLFVVGRVVSLHAKLAWFASERDAS